MFAEKFLIDKRGMTLGCVTCSRVIYTTMPRLSIRNFSANTHYPLIFTLFQTPNSKILKKM